MIKSLPIRYLASVLAIILVGELKADVVSAEKSANPTEIPPGGETTVTLTVETVQPEVPIPLDVVLVLDTSSTMGMPDTKLTDAIDAAILFVNMGDLDGFFGNRVALISFAGPADPVQRTTLDVAGDTEDALNDMFAEIPAIIPTGSTPISDALEDAQDHLDAQARPEAIPVIVLLSDGIDTGGGAEGTADAIKDQGTTLMTMSFGSLDDQDPDDLMNLKLPSDSDFHANEPGGFEIGQLLSELFFFANGIATQSLIVREELGSDFDLVANTFNPEPTSIVGNVFTWDVGQVITDEVLVFSFDITADDCGTFPVDVEDNSFVAYLDGNGDVVELPFNQEFVEVVDDDPPGIMCPPDTELSVDENCEATYDGPPADGVADGCGELPVIMSDPPLPATFSGVGDHFITWTAVYPGGMTECVQTISLIDLIPPVILGVPDDVEVECVDDVPPPVNAVCSDNCDPDAEVGPVESDNGGSGCPFDPLIITRTYDCTDSSGNEAETVEQTITVIDQTAPTVVPGPNNSVCLWPPNHKYVFFDNVTGNLEVIDNCDPNPIIIDVICQSDQCDDAACLEHPGENGDGKTVIDCFYNPFTDQLAVRSERAGTDPGGRTYSLSVIAADFCGNVSDPIVVFTVHVPHDQNPNEDCISPKSKP